MPSIRLEPGNPHDFTRAELEELRDLITAQDASLDVDLYFREERGYGVTFHEVLDVVMQTVNVMADVGGAAAFMDLVIDWAKDRWRRDRDDHPDEGPRPRSLRFWNASGEPIRAVTIDEPDGQVREVDAGERPERLDPRSGDASKGEDEGRSLS